LKGEKQLLSTSQTCAIDIPQWEELGVKKQWSTAMQIPGFMDFIPDEWAGGIRADREYFWVIVFKLDENFTKSLIEDCAQQRHERSKMKAVGPNFTQILPEFLALLSEHQFHTKGKSRRSLLTMFFQRKNEEPASSSPDPRRRRKRKDSQPRLFQESDQANSTMPPLSRITVKPAQFESCSRCSNRGIRTSSCPCSNSRLYLANPILASSTSHKTSRVTVKFRISLTMPLRTPRSATS
jgi:hypothetical protein